MHTSVLGAAALHRGYRMRGPVKKMIIILLGLYWVPYLGKLSNRDYRNSFEGLYGDDIKNFTLSKSWLLKRTFLVSVFAGRIDSSQPDILASSTELIWSAIRNE